MVKKVIVLFLLLLVIPLFSAAPPQLFEGTDKGIFIRYPAYDTVPQNNGFTLHTHVFNESDGVALTNATTSCFLHLYHPNGSHVLQKDFDFDTNLIDYEMEILKGNFSELGVHAFIIQCNNSDAGGAVAGTFEVTYSGMKLDTSQAILYSTIIMVLVLLFILIIHFKTKLPQEEENEDPNELVKHSWLKYLRSTLLFFQWILLVAIFFIISNLSFVFFNEQMVAKLFFALYQIMFALTFPLVMVWLVWIISSILRDKKMKRYIEKGIFPTDLGAKW